MRFCCFCSQSPGERLILSTDSSGPCVHPARGQWGYTQWRDKTYQQPPVAIRGLERARHVQATRQWFENFRNTPHYKPLIPTQMHLWFSGKEELEWNRLEEREVV